VEVRGATTSTELLMLSNKTIYCIFKESKWMHCLDRDCSFWPTSSWGED